MFIYPHEDTIIITFFKHALAILRCKDVSKIRKILLKIEVLCVSHNVLRPHFVCMDEAPEDVRPTPYQAAIYHCENHLLTLLDVLAKTKLMQFGVAINQDSYSENLSTLRGVFSSSQLNPYPLLFMLNDYIRISASIIALGGGKGDLDVIQINNIIINALDIVSDTFVTRFDHANSTYEETNCITPDYFFEIKNALNVMLSDVPAKTPAEEYLLAIYDEFFTKALYIRSCLEKEVKAVSSIGRLPHISRHEYLLFLQNLRDQISRLDALLCPLNLTNYTDLRKKYREQLRVNQLKMSQLSDDSHKDERFIPIVSGLIDPENPIKLQLQIATEFLFHHVTECEKLFEALTLLKKQNSVFDLTEINLTLIYHIKNINFDAKLLLSHAASWLVVMPELMVLLHELQALIRISTSFCYIIEPEQSLQCKATILFTEARHTNLVLMRNDSISCAMGTVLQLKFKICLTDAENPEQRMQAFNQVSIDIQELMIMLADLDKNDVNQIKQGYQMIIDYYLFALAKTENLAELNFLTSDSIVNPILNFDIELQNKAAYHFIYRAMVKYKGHAFNPEVCGAAATDIEHLNQLYQFCILKLFNLKNPVTKIHCDMYAYFLDNAALVIKVISNSSDPVKRLRALELQKIIDEVYLSAFHSSMIYVNSVAADRLLYRPIQFGSNKKSFIPELVSQQKAKPKIIKSSKKKGRAPTSSNARAKHPAGNDVFATVMKFYENNIDAVEAHYKTTFSQFNINNRLPALVGLAECLVNIKNKKKSDKLAEFLNIRAEATFNDAAKIFDQATILAFRQRYDAMYSKWLATAVKPAVTPVAIKPVAMNKPAQVVNVANRTQNKPSVTQVSVFKSLPEASVATPVLPVKPMQYLVRRDKIVDLFGEMRVKRGINIDFTPAQNNVINLLHKNKMQPLIHGGAVVDSLFSIPYRDVDFLCFCDEKALLKLLESNKSELNIQSLRRNKGSDVVVIIFKNILLNGENEEVEIAFLPFSENDHAQKLRTLAKNFGINLTLYYDPIAKTIIDPLNQFNRITKERELDVCQVLSVNMSNYFSDYPDRILDSIYKVAKYRKHAVQLSMSKDVVASISNNKLALLELANKKLAIAKFDKLFILGHARLAFSLLHNDFDLISVLFPMLTVKHTASVENACRIIDEVVNVTDKNAMTRVRLESLRANFIVEALFLSFIETHAPDAHLRNKDIFYSDCNLFVSKINFLINDSVINTIQDLWWLRINELYKTNMNPSKRLSN